jgi:hypothetical protein
MNTVIVVAQRWQGQQVEVLAVVHQGGNAWALCTGLYTPAQGENALGCQWVNRGVTGLLPSVLYQALDVDSIRWAAESNPALPDMIKALQAAYAQVAAALRTLRGGPHVPI